ncbi:MAG: hypothetical protein WA869_29095, partial [Alloacidobacterium sp.]
ATEKKSLHALERDTEANRKRREEFIERIRAIPPERLIYLDESGSGSALAHYSNHDIALAFVESIGILTVGLKWGCRKGAHSKQLAERPLSPFLLTY